MESANIDGSNKLIYVFLFNLFFISFRPNQSYLNINHSFRVLLIYDKQPEPKKILPPKNSFATEKKTDFYFPLCAFELVCIISNRLHELKQTETVSIPLIFFCQMKMCISIRSYHIIKYVKLFSGTNFNSHSVLRSFAPAQFIIIVQLRKRKKKTRKEKNVCRTHIWW